ncbi:MAG: BolA/IbaG family iron-sulfur metabolism protein [Thalassolituus sp.]|uniref:BolA family protein n=1 Tax=Thalassolituus TaxID=187492 RepID=UPI000BD31B46|nr:BolA/IbaG family iron-sulfur metabolism protein [Thalassolituus oleivorans]PCI48365.1 MAG: cell division protein BolA [Oceanospirillales bacterium]PHQ87726.1 MAG: cell division protein BolA [Thalassobium sp.]
MSPAEILEVLQTEAPEVTWSVVDGYVKEIMGVGEAFEGLNAVKRQQYVYKILNPYIVDGSLHAVSIRTFTPAEKADA